MAGKILGQAEITENTNVVVYTVPTGYSAVCNLNLCNTSQGAIIVHVALASGSTPVNKEYIEYGIILAANGVLERTGLVLDAGKNLIVYANGTGIVANAYGYEEAA